MRRMIGTSIVLNLNIYFSHQHSMMQLCHSWAAAAAARKTGIKVPLISTAAAAAGVQIQFKNDDHLNDLIISAE